MRTKLIAGNWKLRGGLLENQVLINQLKVNLCDLQGVDVAICVPYVYLFQAQTLLKGSNIGWGAQNISQYSEGAYTSCISAKMVAEFDACYSIIGHSERRDLKMECNQVATRRLLNALYAGITPIFCIGETLDERESGIAEFIVRNQLLNVVYGLDDEAFALAKKLNMVIAYEPVWAVGTGQYASPHQAQRMHAYIRYMIAERDPEFAKSIRIIYGGSISSSNAAGLFAEPDIDGAVVGRSAWVADDFVQICNIAQHGVIYRKHQAC